MVPVLLVWLAISSRWRVWGELRGAGLAGVLGGIGLVMAFSGAIYSFQTTTVANAVLLFTASPFFAAVLGRILLAEPVSSLPGSPLPWPFLAWRSWSAAAWRGAA